MRKYMINPSDGQGMGYMVVGLSQKLLENPFVMGNERFDSSNFMVVDEDDQRFYFVGNEERENAIMQSYSNPGENHLYLFSSVTNSTTGWHIVNVVEKNEISEESKNIRLTSFLVAGLCSCSGFSHGTNPFPEPSASSEAAGKYHCTGWGRRASHYRRV